MKQETAINYQLIMRTRLKKLLLFAEKLRLFLPYIFVFFASLYRPWDSDLGWHLKYGEYFFQHLSILKENIYSTEMAGYAWPNTNWLTDVFTYAIFHSGGFLGLTVVAALIITLTFWAFSRAFELDFFQQAFVFPVLAALERPISIVSFRGQLISILFLGLELLLLERFSGKKRLVLLPLLFIVWVNTHGQFILGLGILGLYLGFKIVESFIESEAPISIQAIKKAVNFQKNLILTFILVLITGIINPFGLATYEIALSHFNSPELKYILEYLPIEDLTDDWWKQVIYGIMLFFGMLGIIFTGKVRENLAKTGIVSIFYLLAFMVRRYAWSMYYLSIPLIKPVANFLRPDSEKNALRAAVVLFVFYIAFTIYLKLPLNQFSQMNWQTYCSEFNNCSDGAIKFVIDNKLDQNMMSMYNWGGYIIWNYPQIKPSIDGRMTVWKDPQTGYSPLADYYAYETNDKDINDSKYDVVLMGNEKEVYNRLDQLVKQGKWQKRYEDEFGGVFTRIKTATPSSEFIMQK